MKRVAAVTERSGLPMGPVKHRSLMVAARWACGACVMWGALMLGCQTERVRTSDGWPLPPDPKPAPVVPAGAEPNRMTLIVSQKPDDADGNGYPDQIQVACALFAYPHPTSLSADGAFEFVLYRRGESGFVEAEPLATWRLEQDALVRARARALYGECYRFQLSLLDAGTDRLPAMQGDLRGTFIPTNGDPPIPCSDEVRPVQIGRRLANSTILSSSSAPE